MKQYWSGSPRRQGPRNSKFPRWETGDTEPRRGIAEGGKGRGGAWVEGTFFEFIFQELAARGSRVSRQVPVPVIYRGLELEGGYRIDLMVEDAVLVELKSVERLQPVHFAQALTYLRLSGKTLCLLLNFNTTHLRDGIHRVVNHL